MVSWRLVSCVFLIVLTAAGANTVSGQSYPSKPVRFIIPGTGATELVARIVAQGIGERLGQQFPVDIRVGASGNIGAEAAAKAPADGYTIFLATQQQTVSVSLFKKLNYDFTRDFSPVTLLTTSPLVAVVHPSLPVKTIAELVKLAKAKPGAINYASVGVGGPTYLGAELFKMMAGVNLVEVPYNGGSPALNAVIAGEVPLFFAPVATAMPFVKEGRLRALAVSTAKRLPAFSNIPTVAESGYAGYECYNWHGIVVPAKTPREMQIALHDAAVAVVKRPDVAKKLEDLGLTVVGDQPEAFGEFLRADIDKWRKIIQQKGISME